MNWSQDLKLLKTKICSIFNNTSKLYFLDNIPNGKFHREDGPALEWTNGEKEWYYKGKCYGYDNDFNIESWKEKVEKLNREEELKIFK